MILLETKMEFGVCFFQHAWELGKVRFFLGRGRAGASEGRVISDSEHQKWRVTPLCKLFKERVTHLFQIFLMRI